MPQTFRKAERICSEKIIKQLFKKGSENTIAVFLYPFRVVYMFASTPEPLPAVLVSVSKRNFKRAVDRNLLKRRIREAYRCNKCMLLNNENGDENKAIPTYIAFMYIAKEISTFEVIEKKMKTILGKISPNANQIE